MSKKLTRKEAINLIQFAGYHNDPAASTRLYIENRISQAAAQRAFATGAQKRKQGMPCGCHDCQKEKQTPHT